VGLRKFAGSATSGLMYARAIERSPDQEGRMTRGWGVTIVLVVVFLVVALLIIVTDEAPCPSFPSCPLSPAGLWAALGFIGLAVVAGLVRGVAGPSRPREPPPTD